MTARDWPRQIRGGTLLAPPANIGALRTRSELGQTDLARARAIIADLAHHDDAAIAVACRCVAEQTIDLPELKNAHELLRLVTSDQP